MREPFAQWRCDTCGQWTVSPADTYLFWLQAKEDKSYYGFRVVHQWATSPVEHDRARCNPPGYAPEDHAIIGSNSLVYRINLSSFGNAYEPANFVAMLTNWLIDPDILIRDMKEFVTLIHRLTIPHYEEARIYWQQAKDDGIFDEIADAVQPQQILIKRIIERYGGNEL